MNAFMGELRAELDRREADGLRRKLSVTTPGASPSSSRIIRHNGRDLINLAGNDYLALSCHPHLKQAGIDAINAYGTGAAASRLLGGHHPIHEQVEQRFAAFKGAQASLLLATGYTANLAVLTALAGPDDLICLDKLCHASLIDGARASGAEMRIYPHLNLDKLSRLLSRRAASRAFIVTDSIFSMDGDVADLPALCDLADRHRAILVVDEAHATGVLGDRGAGLCELQGVSNRVDVVISTASKALGGLGGIVTARREVIEAIVDRARSFIYSTAVPPAQAAVIDAALDVLNDEPWRRQRLGYLAARLRGSLAEILPGPAIGHGPFRTPHSPPTPIIPVMAGSPKAAAAFSAKLGECGFHAPPIRPPTVAPGTCRLRLTLRADLEDDEIDRLIDALHPPVVA